MKKNGDFVLIPLVGDQLIVFGSAFTDQEVRDIIKLIKEITNEVAYIWINRPEKKNAMDFDVWFGIPDLVKEINEKLVQLAE